MALAELIDHRASSCTATSPVRRAPGRALPTAVRGGPGRLPGVKPTRWQAALRRLKAMLGA